MFTLAGRSRAGDALRPTPSTDTSRSTTPAAFHGGPFRNRASGRDVRYDPVATASVAPPELQTPRVRENGRPSPRPSYGGREPSQTRVSLSHARFPGLPLYEMRRGRERTFHAPGLSHGCRTTAALSRARSSARDHVPSAFLRRDIRRGSSPRGPGEGSAGQDSRGRGPLTLRLGQGDEAGHRLGPTRTYGSPLSIHGHSATSTSLGSGMDSPRKLAAHCRTFSMWAVYSSVE